MNWVFFELISNFENGQSFLSHKMFRQTKVTKFFVGEETFVQQIIE